jgi:hypothetical protein
MCSNNLEGEQHRITKRTAWLRLMTIYPRTLGGEEGGHGEPEEEAEVDEVEGKAVPRPELNEAALWNLFLRLWVLGWWRDIIL